METNVAIQSEIMRVLLTSDSISQETCSQVALSHKVLSTVIHVQLSEAARVAINHVIRYLEAIAIGLWSFDAHKAMVYLPVIDQQLTELSTLAQRIADRRNEDGNGSIFDLDQAMVISKAIFENMINACNKARIDNKWQYAGFAGSVALAGGATGLAVDTWKGAKISNAGITGLTVAGITLVAAGFGGLVQYVKNRNSIEAEATARVISLNLEIGKLQAQARALLRTELDESRKEEIRAMNENLEKLKVKDKNEDKSK